MTLTPYLGIEDGWESMIDGTVRSITPPTRPGVIFGVNVNPNQPNGSLAQRTSDFGRVAINRGPYYGALEAPFDTSLTAFAPEKRIVISFQYTPSQVAAGDHDTAIAAWAESVPEDWWVGLTFWHEPNTELQGGNFTATDYKNAHYHLSALLDGLDSADRVIPCPIYSAPKAWTATPFDTAWMLDYDLMGNDRAIFCWDTYGNPHGGSGLDGPYPPVADVQDHSYEHLGNFGWLFEDGHWGFTEFNAPGRTFDTDETQRAQWIIDFCDYALARPVRPRHIILWTGNGTKWNQNFATAAPAAAYKTFVDESL